MSNQNFSATGPGNYPGNVLAHRQAAAAYTPPQSTQGAAPHNPQQPAHGNPLKNFFRQYKLFIKLPSGADYYPQNVVNYTPTGEIGIMAMTGQDELILKNPDALLNGEALVQVISSCAPSILNVKQLLTNDIDALITAIRYVTYDDKLESIIKCPECSHENLYKIDLEHTLNNMSYLDSEYVVHLDSGLSVYLKPYGFTEVLKSLHTQFEQSKLARAITNPGLSDEERNHILNDVFVSLSKTAFELLLSTVVRVVNESQGIDVSERAFIAEFLKNSDRSVTDRLQKTVTDINAVGVEKKFTPVCEKCNHSWTSEIDFNPVNFS